MGYAFLWDALSFQCTLPVIKQIVHAIQDRHRQFKLGCPVGPNGEYSRYMHCSADFKGVKGCRCIRFIGTLWCVCCVFRCLHCLHTAGAT